MAPAITMRSTASHAACRFLKNHTATAQAHEVCFFDAQVVEHLQDVFCHDVEVVRREFELSTMVTQVEQKQTVVWREGVGLKSTCGSIPCPVDEDHRVGVVPTISCAGRPAMGQSSRIRPFVWAAGGTTWRAKILRPSALTWNAHIDLGPHGPPRSRRPRGSDSLHPPPGHGSFHRRGRPRAWMQLLGTWDNSAPIFE